MIFVGGGIGSVCRYLLGAAVQTQSQGRFPVGTLVVNVLGCVAVGILAKLFLHSQTTVMWRTALVVGFCGGFTTFSTFSFDFFGLASGGEWGRAFGYAAASVILCLAGTALGFYAGPSLNR